MWDGQHPRAALARVTLELAGSAVPAAMFALLERAAEDLAANSGGRAGSK